MCGSTSAAHGRCASTTHWLKACAPKKTKCDARKCFLCCFAVKPCQEHRSISVVGVGLMKSCGATLVARGDFSHSRAAAAAIWTPPAVPRPERRARAEYFASASAALLTARVLPLFSVLHATRERRAKKHVHARKPKPALKKHERKKTSMHKTRWWRCEEASDVVTCLPVPLSGV